MDSLYISSFHSDTSSERSDLPPPDTQANRGPDHYRTATPPSSPLGPVHESDDITCKKKIHRRGDQGQPGNEEVQHISVPLTAVVDRLEDIRSKYLARQPINPEIHLSSHDLTLLHFLLKCDPPFSSRYNLTTPEISAVRKLQSARRKQLRRLGPWFSRYRTDFYDDRLILRMPITPIHADVTNDFTTYLHHRYLVKLREAGREDYGVMLRQGTKSLTFKRRKTRHEPDSNLWLDFGRGFQGNDSEEEAEWTARARGRQVTRNAAEEAGASAPDAGHPVRQVDAAGEAAAAPQDPPRTVLPRTTRWPAIVVEVGWSHPTADDVCVNYIKNGHGHIRCVLRLDMEYIEPQVEHEFETPTKAVLDGWRLHENGPSHEPVHFIKAIDIFAAPPGIKLAITLNDLHSSLPADKEVSLNLLRIGSYVHGAFRSQKRRRDNSTSESNSEADEASDTADRHRGKRVRV